jgi:hypothetical protein
MGHERFGLNASKREMGMTAKSSWSGKVKYCLTTRSIGNYTGVNGKKD